MTYATINSLSVETFSQSWLDDADREWLAISEHPGSVGGLRSFYRVFDYFGRVLEWSRPTEINGYWQPTGDDTGYVYSQQAYDWKGRPTITTHPDSTQRQIGYTGCGCAGGDSLELTDEVGRKMKIYHDILGRVVKSEDLNPDQTVYSTTTTTFNTLDQQTEVRKYVGTNGTSQASIISYDGYGRLWKRKSPAESGDTVFTYQTNNQLLTVTDARGAGATYSYNNRNLMTGINFTESGGATTTPDLTFLYDGGGNRTRMTESGVGQIDYHYDSLSRLEKEERQFTGGPSGLFTLRYEYNLAGQLKKLIDERFTTTVSYDFDEVGRVQSVTSTGYQSVSQFASGGIYRAWDDLKEITYSNNVRLNYSYNSRMRVSSSTTNLLSLQSSTTYNYQYYADGRPDTAIEAANPALNISNRKYIYDQIGRLIESKSGDEVVGASNGNSPYHQTYATDVWGNMTNRTSRHWSQQLPNDSATYVNDRRQGWQYDNAGNVLDDNYKTQAYDVAGRQTNVDVGFVGGGQTGNPQMPAWEIDQSYDGVNRPLKRVETRRIETLVGGGPQTTITTVTETTLYVRSSLLGGQIVYELDESGNRRRANINGIGGLLARGAISGGTDEFRWRMGDPVTGNWGDTSSAGGYVDTVQLDPLGAEVGSSDPYLLNPDPTYPEMKDDEPLYIEGGDPFDLSGGCTLDGMPVPCSFAFNSARAGASVAFSGATPSTAFVGGEYRYLRAFADGTYGLLPDNAFEVNGIWYDSTEMPIPGLSRSRVEYINIIAGDINIMSRNWQRSAIKISQDPCPPTVAELMKNGNVKKALNEAWKKTVWFDPRQPNRGVVPGDVHEEGGWIFWDPKTKQVKTTAAPPGPRARDNNMVSEISLAGPTYPSGNNWILIADYHTHPNMNHRILRNTPDHLRALNNGVPSIIKRGKEIDYVGPSRAGSRPLDARRPLRGYPGDTMDTRHCK